MKRFYLLLLLFLPLFAKAQMTFYIDESVLNSSKKDNIINAMYHCVNWYNDYSNYTKNVRVIYGSWIPTANASYNGRIAFGGSVSGRTGMHEMSHVLGVGTYWKWDSFKVNQWLVDTVYLDEENYRIDSTKIHWKGDSARAMLHHLNGPGAVLGLDKSHFWPYGLNYDNENSAKHFKGHVLMVGALRYDMGLSCTNGQGTGFRMLKMKLSKGDNDVQVSWSCDSAIVGGIIIERSENGGKFEEIYRTTDETILSHVDNSVAYGKYKYRMKRIVPWTDANQYSITDMAIFQREGDIIVSNGKTATASSYEGAFTASKVTDGINNNNASRWMANKNESLPQWVEIDLGDTCDISYLKFYTGWDGFNSPIADFKFQAWDGTDWVNLLDITGNSSSKYEGGFEPYKTTKVRLYITRTSDGIIRLYEIQVYGKSNKLNISTGKTASASSQEGSYSPDKATDGNNSDNASRWMANKGQALPQWIEIDLDSTYNVSYLKFYTGYNGYNKPLNDFKFQAWDGESWVDLLDISGNSSPVYESNITPYKTNKVRLYITKTADGIIRLYEIEVFGEEVAETTNGIYNRQKSEFKLYPNPADSRIYFNLGKPEMVSVVDIVGNCVLIEEAQHSLDISSLMPGSYFVISESSGAARLIVH